MSIRCLYSLTTQSILVAIVTRPPFFAPDVILGTVPLPPPARQVCVCMCMCVHTRVPHRERGEQSVLPLGKEEWVTKRM